MLCLQHTEFGVRGFFNVHKDDSFASIWIFHIFGCNCNLAPKITCFSVFILCNSAYLSAVKTIVCSVWHNRQFATLLSAVVQEQKTLFQLRSAKISLLLLFLSSPSSKTSLKSLSQSISCHCIDIRVIILSLKKQKTKHHAVARRHMHMHHWQ